MSLAKRRGFIFPSSEIYGGLSSTYDYGPLGVELKNNIKKAWWQAIVQEREDIVGLDAAILMHPKVWEASGHVENFTDPLVECIKCHRRYRSDQLSAADGGGGTCPDDGAEVTKPREFNLMIKTHLGSAEDSSSEVFLRPETAQGIYVNFELVKDAMRMKMPFGIAQIGKAFRNEITPRHYTFRTREFEQMEMQYFVHPSDAMGQWKKWKEARLKWYEQIGIHSDSLRFHEHEKDDLAHYAKAAVDIEFHSPFGWQELEGIHHRGEYDLMRHMEYSGKDFRVLDDATHEKYIPNVVETSAGADRLALVALLDAYEEIEGGRTQTTKSTKEKEVVLRFHPRLAPIKVAVFPLAKKPEIQKIAREVFVTLQKNWMSAYDAGGSVGRRYRRQDEIGTPFALPWILKVLRNKP